jgi:Uma2 family endonuclease
VLSPSTARFDLGEKRVAYHRAGVVWYWVADPANRTLTVLKHAREDYLVVAVAGSPGSFSAEPFAQAVLDLDAVFDLGDDAPLTPSSPATP